MRSVQMRYTSASQRERERERERESTILLYKAIRLTLYRGHVLGSSNLVNTVITPTNGDTMHIIYVILYAIRLGADNLILFIEFYRPLI